MQADTPMKRRWRFSALTTAERGKRTRSGVRLRTAPKVQIAISPETCSSRSIGFAPSWPVSAGIISRQRPVPARTARATDLRARILAASPRELGEGGIQNSEFRSQNSGAHHGGARVKIGE